MARFRFRPDQEGIRTTLYDLEADVMEVVWSAGASPCTVACVHRALERARPIAYTTVMTTMNRLVDKGLLARARDGRRYLYRPRLDRDTFLRERTREVLHSLPTVGREEAVAFLVERLSDADAEELDRLEALIAARRRELKR